MEDRAVAAGTHVHATEHDDGSYDEARRARELHDILPKTLERLGSMNDLNKLPPEPAAPGDCVSEVPESSSVAMSQDAAPSAAPLDALQLFQDNNHLAATSKADAITGVMEDRAVAAGTHVHATEHDDGSYDEAQRAQEVHDILPKPLERLGSMDDLGKLPTEPAAPGDCVSEVPESSSAAMSQDAAPRAAPLDALQLFQDNDHPPATSEADAITGVMEERAVDAGTHVHATEHEEESSDAALERLGQSLQQHQRIVEEEETFPLVPLILVAAVTAAAIVPAAAVSYNAPVGDRLLQAMLGTSSIPIVGLLASLLSPMQAVVAETCKPSPCVSVAKGGGVNMESGMASAARFGGAEVGAAFL